MTLTKIKTLSWDKLHRLVPFFMVSRWSWNLFIRLSCILHIFVIYNTEDFSVFSQWRPMKRATFKKEKHKCLINMKWVLKSWKVFLSWRKEFHKLCETEMDADKIALGNKIKSPSSSYDDVNEAHWNLLNFHINFFSTPPCKMRSARTIENIFLCMSLRFHH